VQIKRLGLLFAFLLPVVLLPDSLHAAGSTIPVFMIDANNPSTFTFTGSTVNSAVVEGANSVSGTANSLTFENSGVTNSLIFGTNKYLNFSNNIKPDVTNGASIQLVAYLTSTSYDSSWPRVLDFGSTSGWGSGNDNFSIQLSSTGQLQVYMSRSGTTGVYTCGTNNNVVVQNAFAMYSIQVGPSGVCNIAVNGTIAATTTNDSTVPYSGKIPNTSTTMNFRVGSMSTNVQSTLPNGKIRTVIFSSGVTNRNAVTFMENGGTGFMQSQLDLGSATLNSNLYSRSGYSFTGWNTKADGSGTTYADGATYNFATASTMLFAQWAIAPPTVVLSSLSNATYRTGATLSASINSAGTYTFFDSGKRISGCISKLGSPTTVTCNWKPSRLGRLPIYVIGKVSGSNYQSNTVYVNVVNRTNNR
jgi:hypothetical protein